MVDRVTATDAALELIRMLEGKHGPLIFHLSGGCCDGGSPMCFARNEFQAGASDVFLGHVGGQPFYVDRFQYENMKNDHQTIDMIEGHGDGFSIESPEGLRFIARSRPFTDNELASIAATPATP